MLLDVLLLRGSLLRLLRLLRRDSLSALMLRDNLSLEETSKRPESPSLMGLRRSLELLSSRGNVLART